MSTPLILGHRGGRGEGWPAENTIEAFERAFAEGADGLELDVRLTASGDPVLVHDEKLADGRLVHSVATRELPRLEGGLAIPTLADALDRCAGRVVNVELKADIALRLRKRTIRVTAPLPRRLALIRAVARVIARARKVEIVFSSFDPMTVIALAGMAPKTPRAMLVGASTPRLAVALPLSIRPAIVAAHLWDDLITRPRIARLVKSGLRVVAWTVNDAERAVELGKMGVEWIITDNPRALVERLRS